jgi:pyruvate dehydrogenase E2 component (dihydrolipoamide acetyltransferase)
MRADIVARKIPAEELRGATFTLSNFGMLVGRYAALVVVPPQVAILSTGRVVPRVVVLNNAPAAHRQMPLSLTFDHRVVTGGEAARFLAAVIRDLEEADR